MRSIKGAARGASDINNIVVPFMKYMHNNCRSITKRGGKTNVEQCVNLIECFFQSNFENCELPQN